MVTDLAYFVAWYVLSTLLGAIALPYSFKLFNRLPGKGYAFTRVLGLLLVGYLSWLPGSLGILPNNGISILFSTVLVTTGGLLWLRKQGISELRNWLKTEWRLVAGIEIIFFLAFSGWAIIRAYNPEIVGTEKPMELMFLNAILRSPEFPLKDAWLSGHAISYYYFGYFLVSILARLSSTPAEISFNLALAFWFALTAITSLGVVLEMVVLVKRRIATIRESAPPSLVRTLPIALLGPLLLLLTGNLYGILGLANANGLLARFNVPAIYYSFGENDVYETGSTDQPGIRIGMVSFWNWMDLKQLPQPAGKTGDWRLDLGNWFFAARVLHDRDLAGNEVEAIDENPAFSFLLGDLHPHVLSLPFVILAIGLALEGLLSSRELSRNGFMEWPGEWMRLLLSAIILGSLLALNTWDFPIYAFLFSLALISGALIRSHEFGVSSGYLIGVLKRPILGLLLVFVGAFLLYLPFFITFQSQAGGILPNVLIPTRFRQFMVMFGPLFVVAIFLLFWLRRRLGSIHNRRVTWIVGGGLLIILAAITGLLVLATLGVSAVQSYLPSFLSSFSISEALALSAQRRVVDSLVAIVMAAMVGISAGLLTGILFRSGEDKNPLYSGAVLMTLMMVAVGALLVLGPEFLYLRDNFGTRMNTIFKFYFQTWVLWSMAGAFGIWLVFTLGGRGVQWGITLVTGFLILAGLVYLPAGLWSKTGGLQSKPTLDGMAYFKQRYPNEWAAVEWLRENATSDSILLEGTKGAYWVEGISSRISMATGIPTVIGWVNHEAQWRGNYFSNIAGREGEIRAIYQSRDWQEISGLLDRYGVEYVVVSDQERSWYQPLREAKFENYMEEVFRSGDLVIFRRKVFQG